MVPYQAGRKNDTNPVGSLHRVEAEGAEGGGPWTATDSLPALLEQNRGCLSFPLCHTALKGLLCEHSRY
jgi:hypothetical protein